MKKFKVSWKEDRRVNITQIVSAKSKVEAIGNVIMGDENVDDASFHGHHGRWIRGSRHDRPRLWTEGF